MSLKQLNQKNDDKLSLKGFFKMGTFAIISSPRLPGSPTEVLQPMSKEYGFSPVQATVDLGDGLQLVLKGIRGPHGNDPMEIVLTPEATEVFGPSNKPIRFDVEYEKGGRGAISIEFSDRGVWTRIDLGNGRLVNGVSGLRMKEIGVGPRIEIVPTRVEPHQFNFRNDPSPPHSIVQKIEMLGSPQSIKTKKRDKLEMKEWERDSVRVTIEQKANSLLSRLEPFNVEFRNSHDSQVQLKGIILQSSLGSSGSLEHRIHWEKAIVEGKEINMSHHRRTWWGFGRSNIGFEVGSKVIVMSNRPFAGELEIRRPKNQEARFLRFGSQGIKAVGLLFLAVTGWEAWNLYRKNGVNDPEFQSLAVRMGLGFVDSTGGVVSGAVADTLLDHSSSFFQNLTDPVSLLLNSLSFTKLAPALPVIGSLLTLA